MANQRTLDGIFPGAMDSSHDSVACRRIAVSRHHGYLRTCLCSKEMVFATFHRLKTEDHRMAWLFDPMIHYFHGFVATDSMRHLLELPRHQSKPRPLSKPNRQPLELIRI